jgi:hypothetical protein
VSTAAAWYDVRDGWIAATAAMAETLSACRLAHREKERLEDPKKKKGPQISEEEAARRAAELVKVLQGSGVLFGERNTSRFFKPPGHIGPARPTGRKGAGG